MPIWYNVVQNIDEKFKLQSSNLLSTVHQRRRQTTDASVRLWRHTTNVT